MAKSDLPPLDRLDPAEEWRPWKPTAEQPFDARWAAHLYRRAGFGPSPAELPEAVKNGFDATFDKLLARPSSPRIEPPTLPANDVFAGSIALRGWWLKRMLSGVEPLREKLTLFWHNHFATSINKVQDADLMRRQNDLLRGHALGKFGPFLKQIGRDPAMLIWLDSNQNVKSHPNENYAREIMELFSLGVGNYTEKDIREAARAFTGWHVSPPGGRREFIFVRSEHDDGDKTFFGKTGNWDGDDIVNAILERPACPRFLVRKLYVHFVSDVTPPDKLIQPLADALKKSDYDVSVPVQMILRSRHFFSAHAYRQKVKSPIDYVVGVMRMFGQNIVSPYALINTLELLGQQLFAPPNVKGWEGGRAWLNTATVLARHNFAQSVANGMGDLNQQATKLTGGFAVSVDPLTLVRRERIKDADKIVDYLGALLLPGDLREEVRAKLIAHIETEKSENFVREQRVRDVLYALLTLPEYQMA